MSGKFEYVVVDDRTKEEKLKDKLNEAKKKFQRRLMRLSTGQRTIGKRFLQEQRWLFLWLPQRLN